MTTPMRQQYLTLKSQHPGCILFFRLGDFYETFDDDAKTVARVCDVVLTSKPVGGDLRVPLAGVPYHSVDGYVARLIEAGYKVAIAEQLGTFLYQLHTVPMSEVEKMEIRPSVTNRTPQNWQKLYDDVHEKLFPLLMQFARDWVEQHFAPVLQDPGFMACEPCFMNGDLGTYHLLYNRDTRRLNGIIDFGTAGVGDPAADFGCLIDQYGETFLRQMATFYPGLDQHIERARFWAGTLELQWVLGGLRYPDEPDWFMVHIGRARDVLPIGSGWNSA